MLNLIAVAFKSQLLQSLIAVSYHCRLSPSHRCHLSLSPISVSYHCLLSLSLYLVFFVIVCKLLLFKAVDYFCRISLLSTTVLQSSSTMVAVYRCHLLLTHIAIPYVLSLSSPLAVVFSLPMRLTRCWMICIRICRDGMLLMSSSSSVEAEDRFREPT